MATLFSRKWLTGVFSRRTRLNPHILLPWADASFLFLAIATAHPTSRSLQAGASFLGLGCLLLAWTQGFYRPESRGVIVGPYRFVRYPQRLAGFLLAFGLGLSARSFPAILLSFVLLPLLDWLDARDQKDTGPHSQNDLAGLRYRQHVPALVPTILPYPHRDLVLPQGQSRFSWRRALLHIETPMARLLLLVGSGWVLCLLLSKGWIAASGALLLSAGAIFWNLSVYYRKRPTHNHESKSSQFPS